MGRRHCYGRQLREPPCAARAVSPDMSRTRRFCSALRSVPFRAHHPNRGVVAATARSLNTSLTGRSDRSDPGDTGRRGDVGPERSYLARSPRGLCPPRARPEPRLARVDWPDLRDRARPRARSRPRRCRRWRCSRVRSGRGRCWGSRAEWSSTTMERSRPSVPSSWLRTPRCSCSGSLRSGPPKRPAEAARRSAAERRAVSGKRLAPASLAPRER